MRWVFDKFLGKIDNEAVTNYIGIEVTNSIFRSFSSKPVLPSKVKIWQTKSILRDV